MNTDKALELTGEIRKLWTLSTLSADQIDANLDRFTIAAERIENPKAVLAVINQVYAESGGDPVPNWGKLQTGLKAAYRAEEADRTTARGSTTTASQRAEESQQRTQEEKERYIDRQRGMIRCWEANPESVDWEDQHGNRTSGPAAASIVLMIQKRIGDEPSAKALEIVGASG